MKCPDGATQKSLQALFVAVEPKGERVLFKRAGAATGPTLPGSCATC